MTETKAYETARAAAYWVRCQVGNERLFNLLDVDELLDCQVLVADMDGRICGQVVRRNVYERIQSVVDKHIQRWEKMNPLRRMLTPAMPSPEKIQRAREEHEVSILLGSHLSAGSQRVVHAHMLGHVIERIISGQSTGYSFSSSTEGQCPPLPPLLEAQIVVMDPAPSAHEMFADEFALALLMPPDLVGRPLSDPLELQDRAYQMEVSPRALRRWHDRLQQDPWDCRRMDQVKIEVDRAIGRRQGAGGRVR